MNKKLNTVLFILGATVFNVIVAVISFILLAIVYARYIFPIISPTGQSWGFTVILIGSIAVSIFVYRIVIKKLLDKFDIEKYFDPLFVKRNLKKQQD